MKKPKHEHRAKLAAAAPAGVSSLSSQIVVRWTGPAVITAVSLVMIIWQWRAWPDPYVDFGRELYVPWQLSLGKMLYTDIAYFNGPLSPYFNAIVFRLFGVGLTTIIITNLILTAAITALLYRLIRRVADRFVAAIAGVTFATLFGYGNFLICGNYNFICPYSHEVTHGILLALIAITFLDLYWQHHYRVLLLAVGMSLGLCFLTKAECFLAALASVTLPSCILCLREHPPVSRVLQSSLIVLTAGIMPVVIAFALLTQYLSFPQAFHAVIGAWAWIGNDQITAMPFYKWVMGLDHPAERISTIARWAGIYCLFLLPAVILARLVPKTNAYRYAIAAILFILPLFFCLINISKLVVYYGDFIKPVPFILLATLAISIVASVKQRASLNNPPRTMLSIALLALATTLLFKIFFNCQIVHYGFALAMPATLMTVVLFLYWIPNWISRRGGSDIVFQSVVIALLTVFILCEIQTMRFRLHHKNITVAAGQDSFRADIKAQPLNMLLDYIDRHFSPGHTLAVLPEGIMVNYLARRTNPTPYINIMPPEIVMFGQDAMIRAFEEHPPDYIALVHKNTKIYGFTFFGKDYGQRLYGWVMNHYTLVLQIGATPFQDSHFGTLLLKRNPQAPYPPVSGSENNNQSMHRVI